MVGWYLSPMIRRSIQKLLCNSSLRGSSQSLYQSLKVLPTTSVHAFKILTDQSVLSMYTSSSASRASCRTLYGTRRGKPLAARAYTPLRAEVAEAADAKVEPESPKPLRRLRKFSKKDVSTDSQAGVSGTESPQDSSELDKERLLKVIKSFVSPIFKRLCSFYLARQRMQTQKA
jgi:hypothetical protein